MLATITAWITTRFGSIGLKLLAGAGMILAILAAALRLVAIGRAQERGAAAERRVEAIATKKETDDAVDRADDDDVRARLGEYMRDHR